ncbi:hypothetical protein LTS18_004254 [Coniosporium uncinatum]|uniref:Uncharacterized protein n=1 Tax=Coniosporium uncinatum TaxID=93489 RepID=A0ACC3DZP3_9PEZI|nr:hypothetical protein LTS18_004254 [Coniosporium uncinatum]
MLVAHRRQHHPHYSPNDLPSPTSSQISYLENLPYSQRKSSPFEYDSTAVAQQYYDSLLAADYATSQPSKPTDNTQYMSQDYNVYDNPSIRVQQSTPQPQLQQYGFPQQTVVANGAGNNHNYNWPTFADYQGQMTGTSYSTSTNSHRNSHQRHPSSSSVGSNYSTGHAPGYYRQLQTAAPGSSFDSYDADEASRSYSNNLPTPIQTPTQDPFVANGQRLAHYDTFHSPQSAHMAMKQALMDSQEGDIPDFSHSGRHSVSSFGDHSPATPQTVHGEESDDGFKVPAQTHGETPTRTVADWIDDYLLFPHESDTMRNVPHFERTVSAIYQDELYNPIQPPQVNTSATQRANNAQLLSPYRNSVNQFLQNAQQARSHSPSSAGSRGVSPFRQGSPLAPVSNSFAMPQPRVSSAAQVREQQEQQRAQADVHAIKQQEASIEPRTISPRDALLDYHESEEDAKMPLFPDADSSNYSQQSYSGSASGDQSFDDATPAQSDESSGQRYGGASFATSRPGTWTHPRRQSSSTFSAATSAPPQSSFNFVAPTAPSTSHQPPFNTSQNYRSVNAMATTEETPEFPAHLTSMESSASEAAPPSSNNSIGQMNHAPPSPSGSSDTPKPTSSNADTGTYTCTYHGCTLRFETPQKLQKHKREGHRQVATGTQSPTASSSAATTPTSVGAGMTSAALLARNSQAGPHKCERINPTTGKPCNTVFSRPYDLTRHEDTIHNARKQKVRCALCVEEKTFSRNDALTRHLRVVHPEVDFPGKHRRRGVGQE